MAPGSVDSSPPSGSLTDETKSPMARSATFKTKSEGMKTRSPKWQDDPAAQEMPHHRIVEEDESGASEAPEEAITAKNVLKAIRLPAHPVIQQPHESVQTPKTSNFLDSMASRADREHPKPKRMTIPLGGKIREGFTIAQPPSNSRVTLLKQKSARYHRFRKQVRSDQLKSF